MYTLSVTLPCGSELPGFAVLAKAGAVLQRIEHKLHEVLLIAHFREPARADEVRASLAAEFPCFCVEVASN